MWPTQPVKHRPLVVGEESRARREKSDKLTTLGSISWNSYRRSLVDFRYM